MFWSVLMVSSFRPLWSEKVLNMISILLNLLRLVLCPIMWSIIWNVPCAFEKNVYFASLGWKFLYISIRSIWSRAFFNAAISLLIFCLEDLSIFDSGVLKSPTKIVLLSISFLKSSKIFLIYLRALMLGAYIFTMFVSSWWILPLSIMKWPSGSLFMALLWKSILSDISFATPSFFFSFHAFGIFFSPTLHFQSVYVFSPEVGLF